MNVDFNCCFLAASDEDDVAQPGWIAVHGHSVHFQLYSAANNGNRRKAALQRPRRPAVLDLHDISARSSDISHWHPIRSV